jgi:hypothetical protein
VTVFVNSLALCSVGFVAETVLLSNLYHVHRNTQRETAGVLSSAAGVASFLVLVPMSGAEEEQIRLVSYECIDV